MPKVIENVREQLLCEAKRQIAERGYAKTTVRSVAGACGLGVGTVYNYFPSKELLITTFVAEDWKVYVKTMSSFPHDDAKSLLECIFNSLRGFSESNRKLFSDADAAKVISIGFASRHKRLRRQLADFILPVCEERKLENAPFVAEFCAEALISWALEDVDFDTVYSVLEKVF
ncbi:MAG: TetR/AcrR family transcriptional regulator [Clostridia bacterium]|nr:TetR/AcrR family transcriptional regulator [Clostridia bacterium]